MRRQVFVGLGVVATLLGIALAPSAYSEGTERAKVRGTTGEGTDFDAVQRDQFGTREKDWKPKGWVGPCKKCEERGQASPSEGEGGSEAEPVPGGGEAPLVYTDVALPPPGVALPPPGVEIDSKGGEPPAPMPAETKGADLVVNMPASIERHPDEPTINGTARDLARAEFVDVSAGRSGAFDLDGLQGRFTWSRDDADKPTPILTQYGFATVVELKNGEKPSGGAFCGMCGPEGAFHVEALSDRVGIMPREMSSLERGVLATNLTIITDHNRSLTFNVVEITGLRDRQGRPLLRTDRHEVRGAETPASTVVDWSFEKRVAEASRTIKTQYEAQLAEEKVRAVPEDARKRLETLGDFEVEKKDGGRRLDILSVVTIGDRTLIKFTVPKGTYADPVAIVESGGKAHKVRALARRSTLAVGAVVDGEDVLTVTLEVAAATLEKDDRLAVSIFDKGRGEELRASARKV
ncbi:MAG: hypothetical protein U0166_00705 [Acidobacteriota bacterium]